MQDNVKNIKGKNVVDDNELSLPTWFHKECSRKDLFEDPTALSGLLNGSRQDIYSALSLYQVHVKYATTLIVSLVTFIGVIFSILKVTGVNPDVMRMVGIITGLLMLVGCFLGLLSAFVITLYYKVYVSSLLYGAQIHFAAGMASFHWFMRLIERLQKEYLKKPDISRAKFISKRTWSWKDSHLWYVVFLLILSVVCASIASFIMIVAPLSS